MSSLVRSKIMLKILDISIEMITDRQNPLMPQKDGSVEPVQHIKRWLWLPWSA